MAGAIDLIRDWATGLAYWEQAALEQIVSGHPFTNDDCKYLLKLFLEDAGLIPKGQDTRPALSFPTKLPETGNPPGFRLERLFNLRDVNALPFQQEIRFGPQLTLVYGSNSAGKTGYTRPLGCAAFARGDREVLTDARKQDTHAIPNADIEVSQNDVKKTVTWRNGSRCPELAGVYVFDGASVSAHLNQANALSFSPAGLSILTRLAEVTDTVRGLLRGLIESRSNPHSFGLLFPGDSVVSQEIAKLGASTDITTLENLSKLSADEEKQIEDLDIQISKLKAQNIGERIASLKQEQDDLQALLDRAQETAEALGPNVEEYVRNLVTSLQTFRQEVDRVGADQFRFEPFSQVGTDVWREFISTAKALADAEAPPGSSYPQQGDHCLLCRQALSREAIDLINRLWNFMTSNAPRQLEDAQRTCNTRAGQLRRMDLGYFSQDSPARRILQAEAPAFAVEVETFLEHWTARRSELESSLTSGSVVPMTPTPTPDLSPVRDAINRRISEATALEKSDYKKQLEGLSQTLRTLQHQRTLRDHWKEVKNWAEGQKWAAAAQKKVGSTHHITAKYNELFKALVTDNYCDAFQTILNTLKDNLRVGIETRGQKGTTVRQLVLSPEVFAQKFPVEKILSDGEKRAVALADFLTEVSLDAANRALVLDDPTSSMDSDSKRAVARILCELAAKRQVIVFTHDLVFLHALKVQARNFNVDITSHWICIEGGRPGYVYLDNCPTCEDDYKSAKIAQECYTKAKNAAPAEQEAFLKQGFGALRSSYEAFVVYELFNAVVMRFEERVSFDRLKNVCVEQDIVDEVVEKMGVLSRYIEGHLHSDNYASEKPTPELLRQEIEGFESLRNKLKGRKKAGPGRQPEASTAVTISAGTGKETPLMPKQPGSTAVN